MRDPWNTNNLASRKSETLTNSIIHAGEAIQLKVSRVYANRGGIMSDDKINLQIKNMRSNQSGTLYAPNGVSARVLSAERAKAEYEAECRERDRKEAERLRQARITQENAKKEREAAEKEIESRKQVVILAEKYLDWAERLDLSRR